jgi:small-conductance mechanosensitive channel
MAMWVIVLTFILSKLISSKIVSYIEKNATEESSREELTGMISRVVSITVLTIGFTISLGILWIDMWIFMWGIWFGIWFTLKTFLTNFVAGIMMVTQGFYHNWDVIEIDNQMWKIVKVNALFTAVEQFNGVIFYVPNIKFIEEKVINYYTNDKRRGEIDVLIDYKSDVHKAKQVVVMILDQFPNILKAPWSDVILDQLGDNGILLKARYWVPVKDNYIETKSNITETINMALRKQWIEIAYPHLTVTHTNFNKDSL